MDVIVNAESLAPPLTGIGNYTRHLLEELSRLPEKPRLHCILGDRCHDVTAALAICAETDAGQLQRTDARRSRLLHTFGRSYAAYGFHQMFARRGFERATRHLCNAVYHEPNYVLKTTRYPAVTTVHDLSYLRYPESHPHARVEFLRRHLPRTMEHAQLVLTDSEFVRQELLDEFGLTEEKVRAIPLGVAPDFRPRTHEEVAGVLGRYGLEPGRYVLSVATFEPRKNLQRMLDAHLALPRRVRQKFPLVLAGSRGWGSANLHKRLATLSHEGSIRPIGFLPRAHLLAVHAGAAVFAFPSLYEGFGLPVLEAMASGVPVLTSRNTPMAEFSAGAAELVDPTDADALGEGMLRLLEDPTARQRLGNTGFRLARQMCWSACARRTFEAYRTAEAQARK